MRAMLKRLLFLVCVLLATRLCSLSQDVEPQGRYQELAAQLSGFIETEIKEKQIPGISVALLDGEQIVWARGFGFADSEKKIQANADTVYRVGSVSKLFTDLALMQMVEKGNADLDAPVSSYLPSFKPTNKWNQEITLRMLMAHHSGLPRETPVGNYFDPDEPNLERTIASLNRVQLVYEPGTKMKYSNGGVAVVGRVVEVLAKKPLAQVVEDAVLRPLKLESSSFTLNDRIRPRLAQGLMWTLHGRTFQAPKFELGIAPAGCLYSTVKDLCLFASFLCQKGRVGERMLIKGTTLEEMWTPQFTSVNAKSDIGLGFFISKFDGHRIVNHNGAIYGFATQFSVLPEAKLAVAVIANKDFVNIVVDRIGVAALRGALAIREGKPLPESVRTEPTGVELGKSLEGSYKSKEGGFELRWEAHAPQLNLSWDDGRFPTWLRKRGADFVSDGPIGYGLALRREGEGLVTRQGVNYERAKRTKPGELRPGWEGLIGEYGWDHDVLYVHERDGKLWVLIEWFEFDPLEQVTEDHFKFPEYGLYQGEDVYFTRDKAGRAVEVRAANVVFKRRAAGPEPGAKQLRLEPTRPIKEIRQEALAASPPEERGHFRKSELVELVKNDPNLKLDIRYAGAENFLGVPFYSEARAFLQKPAADALKRAHERLREEGYGLVIFDGYRPWFVTKIFWEATPDQHKFLVADPAQGSRHNRGAAVDLTLYDLKTGREVEMTGTYDEASDRTYPDYPGGTSLQRWHRDLLRRAMESEGFTVYPEEWWHFDYNDWREYPIQNTPFEKLN
jgi:CubicO group peptidase (beta-lactamase class C family)/D-alanyl-D-alanine dipeptidase